MSAARPAAGSARTLFDFARGGPVDDVLGLELVDVDEALATQLAVLDLWLAAGEELGGWKVGLTSGPNRDLLGPQVRPFGYVLRSRVFGSGVQLRRPAHGACRLEPELCLTIGSDLSGPDVTTEEVRMAVRAVSPGYEINEIRLPNASSLPLQVAGGLGQWGIVVGDSGPPPAGDLAETTVDVFCEGERVASTTPGASMDDPFLSVSLLCATLHRYGLGVSAGQHVITGSFSAHPVDEPGTWRSVFRGIGDVSVTFA
jgi:2-keto-4-pentenoate hydratase